MANKTPRKRKLSALPVLLTAALFLVLLYVVVFSRGSTQAELPALLAPAESAEPADLVPAFMAEPLPETIADLRLSELMAKNHTAWCAPDGSFPDWIELYNADAAPVNLEGWRLSDKENRGWVLPAHTLQPGEYLVICADGSGRSGEDLLCADFSLSPGETVFLYSPGGTLADRMICGTETANHSMARDENGEVFESKDPTPGLPNTGASVIAYAASLIPQGPLSINEVVVSNFSTLAQGGKYYDWVELKNISDEPVQLADFYLSDDADEPLLWQFPKQTLQPGQTRLVFCSGDASLSAGGNIHTNFALNASEEDLYLSDADGRLIDYAYLRNIPVGGSMGRHAEYPGWFYFLSTTPKAENGPVSIFIDKTYMAVGTPLNVYNPLGYTLKVFRNGEELSGAEFVPGTDDYESWIEVKAYQGDRLVSEDRAYFSRLPVLYIDTKGGVPIRNKTVYLTGTLTIQNNIESEASEYAGTVSIRGRGNMSWNWPKKPYRIKLGGRADLFGMGENKNWVLLANYLDEGLLRNTTASQISAQLGMPAMQSVWTDVVLNGEYVGNYQLCEQIRLGEGRVDIFDWEAEAKRIAAAICEQEKLKGYTLDQTALENALKGNLSWVTDGFFRFGNRRYVIAEYYTAETDFSGGYLFELSKEFDEMSEFMTQSSLKVMVKSPEALRSNRVMMSYVRDLWEALDSAYRSENGYAETADGPVHYTELADLDSMVSFWLTNEIAGNSDAYKKSRFAYKDIASLIHFGPVWDFDWGGGSLKTPFTFGGGWVLANHPSDESFFKEWLDDPLFVVRATEQYWAVRPYLEKLIEDGGILDTEIQYLRESGLADQARWNRWVTWPTDARGFELDAATYLRYLRERIAWMDEQFSSDAVLLASVRTSLSASPYVKADDLLSIALSGTEDTVSAHAPADYAVPSGASIPAAVTVRAPDTAYLEVYCDGLYVCRAPVQGGRASFVVSPAWLSAPAGSKNVISLIAKSAGGETICRNYITVILST